MNENNGAISAPLDCLVRPVILGRFLFEFHTFQQWVNKARSWFSQYAWNKDTSGSFSFLDDPEEDIYSKEDGKPMEEEEEELCQH